MKARELIKRPIAIESLYEDIKNQNENGHNKSFIPHFIYVPDAIFFTIYY